MKKAMLALTTTAALATVSLPTTADAGCRGCGIGLGILGGVVVGSAIAGAYAYPRTYYPVAGYEPYSYGAAPAYGCPGGYWARRPVRDPYGNVVGWSRPRFFCPAY